MAGGTFMQKQMRKSYDRVVELGTQPVARGRLTIKEMALRVVAAAPDAALAAAFIRVAADPVQRVGTAGDALYHAALIEFFAVHASGFLKWTWVSDWGMRKRGLYVSALSAAYSLPLSIASLVVGSWWPLVTFWVLMANRLIDAVVRGAPEGDAMQSEAEAWAGNTTLFVLVAAVGGLVGFDRTTILAAGGCYFGLNAVSELTGWAWVRWWMSRAKARA
jgi:hypothetical protein